MYKPGDKVKYQTMVVRRIHRLDTIRQMKTGVVEEAFSTLDKKPCYWIEGEKELILQHQIIGGA